MAANKGYIDADGHVMDGGAYRRYIEAPYDKRASFQAGGDSFDRRMDGVFPDLETTAEAWLDMLDQGGLDKTVLFPTVGLSVGFIREPDFAAAFCRAYNNYMSEEFIKVSPRLRAVAILPLQDVDEAVVELRRAVTELNMSGAMLATDGPWVLGDPKFDPLYAEAERLGTMVGLHAGGSLRGRGFEEYLVNRFVQSHTLAHPGAQMRSMVSMILEGVPEKFPGLKIAFLEAGCTWVPFLMDRMDENFEFRGYKEAPLLTKKPSEYVASPNIFVSCEPEERLLPETLRIVGEECIVYATDWPHWDGSYPESLFELEAREDLTPEQKQKILVDNPRRLYGLG